ncbi:hypothetical protein M5689_003803 [Euphorbia peplus]|nr:hypothetical protein M5689_003803 [Euphorbia peplus]
MDRHENGVVVLAMVVLLFAVIIKPNEGTRILNHHHGHHQQQEDIIKREVVLQSLQKGPVPPSAANSCTHLPGRGGVPCTSQRGFAGRGLAYPAHILSFGVAAPKRQ